jgi:hypothetical protein
MCAIVRRIVRPFISWSDTKPAPTVAGTPSYLQNVAKRTALAKLAARKAAKKAAEAAAPAVVKPKPVAPAPPTEPRKCFAPSSKSLSQSNKSRTWAEATKKRRPAQRRGDRDGS